MNFNDLLMFMLKKMITDCFFFFFCRMRRDDAKNTVKSSDLMKVDYYKPFS